MHHIYKLLQFFADEGGAESSVTPDNAGQDPGVTPDVTGQDNGVSNDTATVSYAERLSSLGVPNERIRSRYKDKAIKTQEVKPVETENKDQELTWDKVKDLPFVKDEISKIVRSRVDKNKADKERWNKFAPALEVLARQYNMDASDLDNLDLESLSKAISDDSHYYEDKASEMGVDVETAKHIDALEREKQRRDKAEAVTIEEQKERRHFESLIAQADELKKMYPTFDLRTEMQNPKFVRMTSPGSGLSVQDAYFALHRQEIQNAQAQAVAYGVQRQMSNAYQSGITRPVENGSRGTAGSTAKISYANMSKADREAIKAEMRAAAAEGRKFYLNY